MLDYRPVWKSGVYRCNAQGHGYLTGGHPRGSEGVVSRTVCFAYSGSSCWHSTSIRVKNCGSYFVYYLNNLYGIWTANRVSLRYCGAGEVVDSLANPCQGYNTLSDASRSVRQAASYYTNDLTITGWHRFMGAAGNKIAEHEITSGYGTYHCASLAHGWLDGKHPSQSDGKVYRRICFAYGGTGCWQSIRVMIRNCGGFYVYNFLRLDAHIYGTYFRYCGVGLPVDNVANPCRSYTRLTDATRSIRYFKSNLYSNDRNILGWYRFEEGAGDMLVPHEPRWQSRVYRCQAIAYGWLNGKHPTQAEGKVFRKACFAYNGDSCWHTTDIKVQNCGSFYVYLLDGLAYYRYSDYLRYCGVGEPEDKLANPCLGYQVLSGAARSIRKISSSYSNDHRIDGWYRFDGDAGSTLVENEPRWKSNVYRCQSAAHGWLDGKHPKVSDGKVYRTACFAYNGDGCWQSTKIKIKNCGNFYVYLLNGLYFYRYSDYIRYCGIGETPDTTPDPCQKYKIVLDASRSILVNNQTYTNDHSISGWYRFMGKAGSRMVEYNPQWKPNTYRCMSSAHGWLTGKHPRGSEGKVNRTVCFSYNGDTCWYSTKIKIRNCGDFYVYLLNNLYYYRYSDYMRYCGAGETENNYPCRHYQLLTERTRIGTYRGNENAFCDKNVRGWYRFWGEAGHRMLNKCPLVDDKMVFPCGSYYHGWLNATNPTPLDGDVNRTMCFSHIASCNCVPQYTRQIGVRNCGSYFVYNLKGLSDICTGGLALAQNARYCGMRDKDAYEVTCSPNYMRIDLDRRYYNSSKFKSITLGPGKCKHVLSYDYISLGSIPGACGSTKKESKTEIIYINYVKLVRHFGSELISRENDETIYFKCSYKRDAVINNGASFKPVGEIVTELANFGNFTFNFNTYRSSGYETPVKSFPINLKLRDWLYFEVNATVGDPSLVLLIERCYSTPTMNPDEPVKYDLIKGGCSVDIATSFDDSKGLRRRFNTQVFRFENSTAVYIHCLVFLCRRNSTDNRCISGCTGNNILSRKRRDNPTLTNRGDAGATGFYKLDSGRIMLEGLKQVPTNPKDGGTDKSIPVNTLMFGGIGAIVLLLIIIIIVLLTRRRGPPKDSRMVGKDIGKENLGKEMDEICDKTEGNV